MQRRAGHEVRGFPALVDEGATVGLQVLRHGRRGRGAPPARRTPPPAPRARPGRPVDEVLAAAGLDQRAKLALVGSPYPSVADLLADVRAGIVGEVVDHQPTARDEAAYDAVVAASREAVASGLGRPCTT